MGGFEELEKFLDKRAKVVKGPNGVTEATDFSVGDLVRVVERCHTGSYQYRGQRKDWPLLPPLTRGNGPCRNGLDYEKGETCRQNESNILKDFRAFAAAYGVVGYTSNFTELQLAILGQHHGLPTRLLDWTMNPLAALYFAVEEESCEQEDAVVWAIHGRRHRLQEINSVPFDNFDDKAHFVIPDRTFSRSAVQGTILAFWRDLDERRFDEVVDKSVMWKFVIPHDMRTGLKWILYCLGISRETLFPDLDGLGTSLAWKHWKRHQRDYEANSKPQAR